MPRRYPIPDPAASELHLKPVPIEVDAELYEIMYPDRVERIVAAGGLPPDLDFGPPEPRMVAALVARSARSLMRQDGETGPGQRALGRGSIRSRYFNAKLAKGAKGAETGSTSFRDL